MQQFDAAHVAARLDRRTLIDALDTAFRHPHQIPERQQYQLEPQSGGGHGVLLLMPAWDRDAIGIKVVTVFADNAQRGLPAVNATYLLLDALSGEPRAMLNGTELTLRRTAAASALASRYLSSPDASRLLMVGTGRMAPHLIESHLLTRPIREVRIWGRRTEAAAAVAASLQRMDLTISTTADLEASTRWADIVSCATLSHRPLLQGAWLHDGQHVDLVGAFTPQMHEVDDAAIARAALYVDTRAGVLRESGEIIDALARGVIDSNALLAELSDLATGFFKRPDAKAITLFKSVGTALADLVAAKLVLYTSSSPTR